ncbi:fungal peroxidase [Moniliophthora roreri]|nr:fungal peroxidase [Moniliophthora roreri]
MRLSSISVAIALIVQCTFVAAGASRVKPRRTSSILINPDAQPDLPSANEAKVASESVGLNLDDIQGDILVGMKKDKELFFFFGIQDAATFKSKLASDIRGLITSTTQLLDVSLQPTTAVNIAFSQTGLNALGNSDNLQDSLFKAGQFNDALALADPGTGNWVQGFAGTSVHGVFLIASDTQANVDAELANIQNILGNSIVEIHRLQGAARPGNEKGHEHFGYMDGISQPAIKGFVQAPLPGQAQVDPGVIITAETGDANAASRPAWTKGGSFLAFRQLKQRVPEFNKFLIDNALSVPGLTQQENADLLGARMIGRWKSGAPIDLTPLRDDPALAADPQRNNFFNYNHTDAGFDITTNLTMCPFSAHTRKTRPRADFSPENTRSQIMRAGIPYGPEVTEAETSARASSDASELERGLAFVSYQSNLSNGFAYLTTYIRKVHSESMGQQPKDRKYCPSFLQNTPLTVTATRDVLAYRPGVDPIIGSTNSGPPGDASRTVNGLDPLNFQRPIVLNTDFVVSRGGEYFFSPPISALLTLSQNRLASCYDDPQFNIQRSILDWALVDVVSTTKLTLEGNALELSRKVRTCRGKEHSTPWGPGAEKATWTISAPLLAPLATLLKTQYPPIQAHEPIPSFPSQINAIMSRMALPKLSALKLAPKIMPLSQRLGSLHGGHVTS